MNNIQYICRGANFCICKNVSEHAQYLKFYFICESRAGRAELRVMQVIVELSKSFAPLAEPMFD